MKVLIQIFELSVWNFEIFNEILLRITLVNSSRATSVACYSAGFYRAMFAVHCNGSVHSGMHAITVLFLLHTANLCSVQLSFVRACPLQDRFLKFVMLNCCSFSSFVSCLTLGSYKLALS